MTTTNLINFRLTQHKNVNHAIDILPSLTQLVGEAFHFARMSYGDELTLHFGDLRPAKSPKLKNYFYGSYIIGSRGSPWIIKAGTEPLLLAAGLELGPASEMAEPTTNEGIETNPLIKPGSVVVSAIPFDFGPQEGFGLRIRLSDESTLLILPTEAEAQLQQDQKLPIVADWELASPTGVLSVGPGATWSFKPRKSSRDKK